MEDRSFEARFLGSAVEDGSVPFDELLNVLTRLQSAVRHMVEDLVGREPSRGPLPHSINEAGSLILTGTQPGSFVAQISLADKNKTELLNDYGAQALDLVLDGVAHRRPLPARVQSEIDEIASGFDEGLNAVEFHRGPEKRVGRISWSEPVRRVAAKPKLSQHTLYGRILEVDWKDHTAELHAPDTVTKFSFTESLEGDLQRLAREHVSLIGEAEVSNSGQVASFEAASIIRTAKDREFWSPLSVVELMQEQGVGPFEFPETSDDPEARRASDELLANVFGD